MGEGDMERTCERVLQAEEEKGWTLEKAGLKSPAAAVTTFAQERAPLWENG